MLASARGHTPGQVARRGAPLARHFKGKHILDLYAGTGGVARAAVQQGCNAYACDRANGPAQDLTDAKVLGRLSVSISRGEVLGAAMGLPM